MRKGNPTMATAQRPASQPASPPQYESYVEQQFGRARRRILGFDLAAAALLFVSAVLAYGLVVALADRLWDLSGGVRLAAWCMFTALAAVYLGWVATRLGLRRVNPHFIARQLEQTVPNAKNSVINWLDLRDQPLAPVIRGSLGRRAAKDLTHADPEQAISARPLWWLGGLALALLLLQVCWLIAAPSQVLSLLQRAYFPFEHKRIAARTELTLLQPETGDVSVPANQPVAVRVKVQGRVPPLNQPDSLKLHFRYERSEPFEERPLLQDVDGSWTTVVLADQVRTGFYYKITGGDARLPEDREYRVDVRAIPQVLRFEVSHTYRPYLRLPSKKIVYDKNVRPSIKELRGTETTVIVHTNRPLERCILELKTDGLKKDLVGQPLPGDPEAWSFKWTLDQSGEFRILFKSKDGEPNLDRQPCKIEVIPDRAPEVVLTKPGRDIALPANGTLVLEGQAKDDLGVKSLQLRLRVLKGSATPELKPKVFREGKSFQLVNGKFPLVIDYSDFITLDTLQTLTGEMLAVVPGMELEYWLEARDNCDYPDNNGNLGQSARYKVTIGEPEKDKGKVQEERASAKKHQQEHNKKQDDALKGQNLLAEAQEKAGNSNAANQAATQKERQDLANEAGRVDKAIDEQRKQDDARGTSKPDDAAKGDKKDQGPKDSAAGAGDKKDGQPDPKDAAGKNKDEGGQGQGNDAGQAKDKGQQAPNPQANAKDQGQPDAGKQPPGTTKDDGKKDNSASEAKPGPQDPKDAAGDGKDKGMNASAGASKDGGMDAGGMNTAKADKKDAGMDQKGSDAGSAKSKDGDSKAGGAEAAKGDSKPGPMEGSAQAKGPEGLDGTADLSQTKGAGQPDGPKQAQAPPGEIKGTSTSARSAPKEAPTTIQSAASAKGGDLSDQKPPADARAGPADPSQMTGNAKTGDRKDATLADVAKLQEQLNDPAQRDQAERGLEKVSQQAGDAKVRQAADKALEQAKGQAGQAKTGDAGAGQSANKDRGQPANPKDGGAGATKNAKAPDDAGKGKQDSGPGATSAKSAGMSKKPGSGNPGTTNQGSVGQDNIAQANPVDEAAARRAGNLQLESLKKQIDKLRDKLTPKVLERLNWTAEERDAFLQKMLADALLRQQQQNKVGAEKLPVPGSIQSLLPVDGPRLIGREPGGAGSVSTDRAEAPPEVREAQRIFLNK
jgi:hypothetical protein